ncbi:MAG: YfcC family protein, partial [Inhella sp.]
MNTPRRFTMPDVFVILFFLALVLAALSHLVPAGVFDTTLVNGKPRLIPESFRTVEGWQGVALFGSGD